MLGHKTSLNKCKKGEIISSIFSNHNGMKLEINYKKKLEKTHNYVEVKNMLLNNQWSKNTSKEKSKNSLRQIHMELQHTKLLGWDKSSKREIHRDKCLSQETRKTSNDLTLQLKELEKEHSPKLVKGRK